MSRMTSPEEYLFVVRFLFDRLIGKTVESLVYDEARAMALMRVAELDKAMELTVGGESPLYTAEHAIRIVPSYTIKRDRNVGMFTFFFGLFAVSEEGEMGRMIGYRSEEHYSYIVLDTGEELRFYCSDDSLSPQRKAELSFDLRHALSKKH